MFSRKHICCLSVILTLLFIFATGCGGGADARVTKQLELAVKYLSEKKFGEAILAYQEAIKIDPHNAQAYKGLSITYYLLGKTDQAERALQDGLKQVPDSKPLKLAMAGLMVDTGKVERAEALYKEIISQDGKYLPAYQAYCKLLAGTDRQAEAVSLLEKAAAANPDHYQVYSMLAEVNLVGMAGQGWGRAARGGNVKSALYTNRSITLEELVEAANARYRLLRIALIDKFPTGFVPLRFAPGTASSPRRWRKRPSSTFGATPFYQTGERCSLPLR